MLSQKQQLKVLKGAESQFSSEDYLDHPQFFTLSAFSLFTHPP